MFDLVLDYSVTSENMNNRGKVPDRVQHRHRRAWVVTGLALAMILVAGSIGDWLWDQGSSEKVLIHSGKAREDAARITGRIGKKQESTEKRINALLNQLEKQEGSRGSSG